jgi:hypothetical protein
MPLATKIRALRAQLAALGGAFDCCVCCWLHGLLEPGTTWCFSWLAWGQIRMQVSVTRAAHQPPTLFFALALAQKFSRRSPTSLCIPHALWELALFAAFKSKRAAHSYGKAIGCGASVELNSAANVKIEELGSPLCLFRVYFGLPLLPGSPNSILSGGFIQVS